MRQVTMIPNDSQLSKKYFLRVNISHIRNVTLLLVMLVLPTEQIKFSVRDLGSKVIGTACSVIGLECCRPPFVTPSDEALSDLRSRLSKDFFGQHVAANTVLTVLESHLNDENPSKALVLSFHGWAGSGKTFLSEQIMQALYKEGTDSKFVRFYMASYHFPDPNKVMEYQHMLRHDVSMTATRCERALFVFDEVDKAPPGIFDALVPFIQYPGKKFEGLNFKRSIFIFISNNGANDITRITYKSWKDGRRREDLAFNDFEQYLSNEAFNKKENGLYRSRIIDKILVDFFIPFLPMQREHVISCAKAEMDRLGRYMDPSIIVNNLAYWPTVEKLYSQTGCKKVEGLVKYYVALEDMKLGFEDNEDADAGTSERTEL